MKKKMKKLFDELFKCRSLNLRVAPVASFHQCGKNRSLIPHTFFLLPSLLSSSFFPSSLLLFPPLLPFPLKRESSFINLSL